MVGRGFLGSVSLPVSTTSVFGDIGEAHGAHLGVSLSSSARAVPGRPWSVCE